MTKIVTNANNKGGTGKTFLSKNMAEYGALVLGLRTLIIDLDPQANASRRYLEMELAADDVGHWVPPVHDDYNPNDPDDADWDGRSSTANIWLGSVAPAYPTAYPNLFVLPADSRRLQEIEEVNKEEVEEKIVDWFKEFINLDEIKGDYDLIVIDTRPSKGPLVRAALNASTHLVIPTEMEAPSVEGLHGMLSVRSQANARRSSDDQLALVGILANKVRTNTIIHSEYMAALQEDPLIGPQMLRHHLNDWVAYKQLMPAVPKGVRNSIFDSPPSQKEHGQMMAVCGEIFSKMGFEVPADTKESA